MNILTRTIYLATPLGLLRQVGPEIAVVAVYIVNQVQLAKRPTAITLDVISRDCGIPKRSLKRIIRQLGQIGISVERVGYPAHNVFSVDFAVLHDVISRGAKSVPLGNSRGAKSVPLEHQGDTFGPSVEMREARHSSRGAKSASDAGMRVEATSFRGAKSVPIKEEVQILKEKEGGGEQNFDTPPLTASIQQGVTIPEFYARANQNHAGRLAEDYLSSLEGIGRLLKIIRQSVGVREPQWHGWLVDHIMSHRDRLGDRFAEVVREALVQAQVKPAMYMLRDISAAISSAMPATPTTMPQEEAGGGGVAIDTLKPSKSAIERHLDDWLGGE